ncbi:MAG: cation acetate symporter [Proteobacteria bacterium]|nr:cation acetate symporter [Pseudomonadota bacterium]
MSIQAWTYAIVGATFALYIGVAIWSRVASTSGFYVAGRGVPPLANGMATGADWMSAASFISMAGLISFMGYTGTIYLMGWTGGYVLLALLLAPYLRKYGRYTVPEFVGDRYYSQTARVVAVFCAIFVSFTYVAGQMRGVGVVFSRFLEVDVNVGVVIGVVIVFFYAVMGGMRGITYTQVAQYCVLIVAYLVPAAAISWKLTGHPIPQLGFGAELAEGQRAGMALLEALDAIHRDLGLPEYTGAWVAGKKGMLDVLCITMALMVGTAGLPHVLIRFYTVPTARAARWSAMWALVFIGLLYTTAPAVAAFARVNMIQTLHETPIENAPEWFRNWEKTGLIGFDDKNGDGRIQYSGDADVNELRVDRDIMVLANPEIAELPAWVVALVAAGGLAAALSTAAGLLLVISASISHDLLKSVVWRDMSEADELRMARLAAALAVVVAGIVGIYPPGFVAQVVAFAFGLAAASFFPILVLGIFSRRTTKEGAIAGMLTGIGFTAAYIVWFRFFATDAGTDDWLFGISPEGIGAVGMLLNFAVTLAVSHATAPPPAHVQAMVDEIRLPGGHSDEGT